MLGVLHLFHALWQLLLQSARLAVQRRCCALGHFTSYAIIALSFEPTLNRVEPLLRRRFIERQF